MMTSLLELILEGKKLYNIILSLVFVLYGGCTTLLSLSRNLSVCLYSVCLFVSDLSAVCHRH